MQKIVVTYTEELMPLAIEMINHLVETFAQVSTYFRDEKVASAGVACQFSFVDS